MQRRLIIKLVNFVYQFAKRESSWRPARLSLDLLLQRKPDRCGRTTATRGEAWGGLAVAVSPLRNQAIGAPIVMRPDVLPEC